MNKLHSTSFILGFIFLGLLPAQQAVASFPDVPSNHSNNKAIEWMQQQQIVEGNPDGTYRPDSTINRAEFVKILIGATPLGQGVGCDMQSHTFSDVPEEAWYAVYVCLADSYDYVDGYSDGTFKPGNLINFAEAAKIIAKEHHARTSDVHAGDIGIAYPWYRTYTEYLAERNAIPKSITKFDKELTRGEMAEILWRLNTEVIDLPSQTYDSINNFTPVSNWETNKDGTYIHVTEPYFSFRYPPGVDFPNVKYPATAFSTDTSCTAEDICVSLTWVSAAGQNFDSGWGTKKISQNSYEYRQTSRMSNEGVFVVTTAVEDSNGEWVMMIDVDDYNPGPSGPDQKVFEYSDSIIESFKFGTW